MLTGTKPVRHPRCTVFDAGRAGGLPNIDTVGRMIDSVLGGEGEEWVVVEDYHRTSPQQQSTPSPAPPRFSFATQDVGAATCSHREKYHVSLSPTSRGPQAGAWTKTDVCGCSEDENEEDEEDDVLGEDVRVCEGRFIPSPRDGREWGGRERQLPHVVARTITPSSTSSYAGGYDAEDEDTEGDGEWEMGDIIPMLDCHAMSMSPTSTASTASTCASSQSRRSRSESDVSLSFEVGPQLFTRRCSLGGRRDNTVMRLVRRKASKAVAGVRAPSSVLRYTARLSSQFRTIRETVSDAWVSSQPAVKSLAQSSAWCYSYVSQNLGPALVGLLTGEEDASMPDAPPSSTLPSSGSPIVKTHADAHTYTPPAGHSHVSRHLDTHSHGVWGGVDGVCDDVEVGMRHTHRGSPARVLTYEMRNM